MARWFLVLALIATIVACPYRCGGAFGDACAAEPTAEASDESASCGCGCCRQQRSGSPERDSDSPLPEPCDCGGCVCEGAVLPEKVVFVADDAPAAPLAAILASTIALESSELPGCVIPSPDEEPTPSGRSIRLLRCSLLI